MKVGRETQDWDVLGGSPSDEPQLPWYKFQTNPVPKAMAVLLEQCVPAQRQQFLSLGVCQGFSPASNYLSSFQVNGTPLKLGIAAALQVAIKLTNFLTFLFTLMN